MDKIEIKLNRLKSRYPYLFPLNIVGDKNEKLSIVKEHLEDVDVTKSMMIFDSTDNLKLFSLYALLKLHKYVDCEFMNAYRLVNIFLGLDEVYQSIQSINSQVTIVYLGYAEMENKRQAEILCQFIEQQIVANRVVWLYYKGSRSVFTTKYTPVLQEVSLRGFQEVILNSVGSSDIEEF